MIYLGTQNVETIDGYMDRVTDNLDSFWQSVFSAAGSECELLAPERRWVATAERAHGPCGNPVDAFTGAYYCPSSTTSSHDGAIAVGTRWMFESIYEDFGDRAEFAIASVLAHEMGHHVQDVLGILLDSGPRACCQLASVNVELQADCLAGVWAYSLFGRDEIDLETMEQVVRAAQAAGDTPVTDPANAHGNAEQRRAWFTAGFDSGRVSACDAVLVAPL